MPVFCPNCRSIIFYKKTGSDSIPYCFKCGKVEIKVDPEAYKSRSIKVGSRETVVINRTAQLEELKKQYGERKFGSSCPKCGSFYLTKQFYVTRGDEAGKTLWNCIRCGTQFRRPVYVPRQGGDSGTLDNSEDVS